MTWGEEAGVEGAGAAENIMPSTSPGYQTRTAQKIFYTVPDKKIILFSVSILSENLLLMFSC